mmetsp:Transcript_14784/g.45160  ORF Transcript_14784/g.45160 Transcript_14784/m.45160 type:complete len:373 (+) Transcript_14784:293-1411(+)
MRSSQPTGSPVTPMMRPVKPPARSWRVASVPDMLGIWLSMMIKSKCSPLPRIKSTAADPSCACTQSTPMGLKSTRESVRCTTRSSSAWRIRTAGPLLVSGIHSGRGSAGGCGDVVAADCTGARVVSSSAAAAVASASTAAAIICPSSSSSRTVLYRVWSNSRARTCMTKRAPLPMPSDSMARDEPLCRARNCRAIVRPRPVPPLPSSWPLPTWAKGSPPFSTLSSRASMPHPESSTTIRRPTRGALSFVRGRSRPCLPVAYEAELHDPLRAVGKTWRAELRRLAVGRSRPGGDITSPPPGAAGCGSTRSVTAPALAVKRRALDTPRSMHWASMSASPTSESRDSSGGTGAVWKRMPARAARSSALPRAARRS